MPKIDPLSIISLNVEALFNETALLTGTAFIIKKENRYYLVTNWHIVTCLDPVTKKTICNHGGIPNKLLVWHHQKDNLGTWLSVIYDLLNPDDSPRWKEMAFANGDIYDVVLLEIPKVPQIEYYCLDLALAFSDLVLSPSEQVSIIGFPFGKASFGKFPIWKTGNIASDIDLNYNEKPTFLIDVTTKPGMSGSPVIAKRIGAYQSSNATANMGSISKFMGVYSGRIQDEEDGRNSNLGVVWKPSVIEALLG